MDENPRESEYNFKSPQPESLESHTVVDEDGLPQA
jgi:hypothetical protein